MKKEYIYNPKSYFVQVVVTSVFCIAILFVSLYMIITNTNRNIFCFVGLIALYTFWNTFVTGSNPSKIILEENGISFVSFGRTVKYLFDEIHIFMAKDFRSSGRIFLRINKYNLFKGRYWVNAKEFNDSYELFLFLLKLEYKMNPDSLKSRAWDSTRPDVDKTPVLPWNLPVKEQDSKNTSLEPW
jgi:hypothetical protein